MEAIEAVEASVNAFMEASMEDRECLKASTEVTTTGASIKASTKTSMEVMEAFMGMTSPEVFMEASVEASMEDMEDMKASTEATNTEAFMGASVSFCGSFHGRYGRYEPFRGVNSTGASTIISTKASMEVMEAFAEVMEASMEETSVES